MNGFLDLILQGCGVTCGKAGTTALEEMDEEGETSNIKSPNALTIYFKS